MKVTIREESCPSQGKDGPEGNDYGVFLPIARLLPLRRSG
ncbi:hypothetical protein JOD44_002323 [Salimicrobium jeotgali]|nr:hypothetical protein [Salimicrobium jeotgali]